jgi:transposase
VTGICYAVRFTAMEMTNRHTSSPFWTRERDARLRKLQRAGLSLDQIAMRLGVTRKAVVRRSYYLRGLVYPSQIRAKPQENRTRQKARDAPILAAMRKEIRNGVPRNAAIVRARQAGASLRGLREELRATRQLVWRALVEQGFLTPRSADARAESARKAIAYMRRAISRGMLRDRAIAQAYNSGATHQAIADELGLTRQRVHQIVLSEQSLSSPLAF